MPASPSRTFLALLALVAGVQTAALAAIVVNRDRLLKKGREVVMAVRPLDPRDIFRGDYVTLGYPITQITLPDGSPQGLKRGEPVYVVAKKGEKNAWTAIRASATFPTDVTGDDVVLRGRILSVYGGPDGKGVTLNARYGIETYFVPEGTGTKIEEAVREHTVEAVLAVGADGEAALKGLIIDNVRTDEPPIF